MCPDLRNANYHAQYSISKNNFNYSIHPLFSMLNCVHPIVVLEGDTTIDWLSVKHKLTES